MSRLTGWLAVITAIMGVHYDHANQKQKGERAGIATIVLTITHLILA